MTDEELRAELRGIKDELRAEMRGVNEKLGGMREDLRETRDELRSEMAGIKETMGGLKEELTIRIEKAETNLLTAFHGWASPMEMRQRGVKNVVSEFDDRLVLLEERVRKLEAGAAGIS